MSFERCEAALNQHHLQLFVVEPEDDAVHRQCAARVLVCEWNGSVLEIRKARIVVVEGQRSLGPPS